MIHGTGKPKIPSKFVKRTAGCNEFRCKSRLGDRRIKQLLNSVLAKYRGLSVSRRSINEEICSPYFVQPRPIIVNCNV